MHSAEALSYQRGITGAPHERLVALAEALNRILAKHEEAADKPEFEYHD